MTNLIRIPFFLMLMYLAGFAAAQGSFDEKTRTQLPTNVDGFTFVQAVDLEASTPGAGTGIRYEHEAYWTSVYISQFDPKLVAENFDTELFKQFTSAVINSQLRIAISQNPKARQTIDHVSNVKTGDTTTQVKVAVFRIYVDGLATNDFHHIWIAKNQYWRLRMTRIPGKNSDFSFPFLNAMVKASLSDAPRKMAVIQKEY
jgi:hypothetical protein